MRKQQITGVKKNIDLFVIFVDLFIDEYLFIIEKLKISIKL